MKNENDFLDTTTMIRLLNQNRVIPVLRHIAHDLNNSVWSILANLEVMEQIVSTEDQTTQDLLQAMKSAVERASADCRKATSVLKTTTTDRMTVDLSSLFNDVASIVRRNLPPNINCTIDTPAERIEATTTFTDALLLLWSTADNSCSAIGREAGEIRVSFSRTPTNDFSVVTISDNGCGMDEAILADCQDGFAGVDKAKLGIGLTAVAETMQSHQGKVKIDSELGAGTTVRLLFPTNL